MYQNGEGVLQDYREAASWFYRSAVQGYAPAQFNLAGLFGTGRGDMATRNLFVRILSLVAFRESKRRDPRVPPVWVRRLRVIFVRIPKRAVVRRIYCHLTVIAPGKAGNLRTMSFDNRDLFARQLAQRVRGPSARIMN